MEPGTALWGVLTHPAFAPGLTFVAAMLAGAMVARRPLDKAFWDEVKEWPGMVLFGATFGGTLASALPHLVYTVGVPTCEGGFCRTEGGGTTYDPGTGLGGFLAALVIGFLLDLPAAAVGGLVGTLAGRAGGGRRPAVH